VVEEAAALKLFDAVATMRQRLHAEVGKSGPCATLPDMQLPCAYFFGYFWHLTPPAVERSERTYKKDANDSPNRRTSGGFFLPRTTFTSLEQQP
jgi:hypothetical protein